MSDPNQPTPDFYVAVVCAAANVGNGGLAEDALARYKAAGHSVPFLLAKLAEATSTLLQAQAWPSVPEIEFHAPPGALDLAELAAQRLAFECVRDHLAQVPNGPMERASAVPHPQTLKDAVPRVVEMMFSIVHGSHVALSSN